MSMISSPDRSGNEACERPAPLVAWLLAAALVLGCQAVAQEQEQEQEQEQPQTEAPQRKVAVLKLHEVSFFYRSRVSPLSCSDLEGRVSSVLRVLGARDDVRVDASGCEAVILPLDEPPDAGMTSSDPWQSSADPWGTAADRWRTAPDRFGNRNTRREQSSHVRIRAMMPIEVTPEVLEEIRKDKSRRELVSRLTGNPAAARNDPILFPAQRRMVTLSTRTLDLEPGECELLEQMSTSILRQLNMRVVRRSNCGHDRFSRIPPRLTVETLMPIFEQSPEPTPAAGEPEPGAAGDSEAPASEPATDTPPK